MANRQKKPARRVLQLAMEMPWAITEPALRQILEIASRSHEFDITSIEAKLGRRLDNSWDVTLRDGVATIPVHGPLFRYANLFSMISGATSYETLATDFNAALDDSSIRAILFDFDSPGGECNGCQELAEMIFGARGRKPIMAYVSGQCCSAAYLLASACDEIAVAPMGVLGSIGVQLAYEDDREAERLQGIQSVRFTSSQSPNKNRDPMTKEGASDVQTLVDDLATVMIESVARNRGVTAETILSQYGQGAVFVGTKAVQPGMAEQLSTYEALHLELASEALADRRLALTGTRAISALPSASVPQEPAMKPGAQPTAETPAPAPAPAPNAEEPAADPKPTCDKPGCPNSNQPESAEALAKQYPTFATELRGQGAAAERDRLTKIDALARPGREKILAECKADPTCTPEAAAYKLELAATAARGSALTSLKGDEEKITAPTPAAGDVAAPGSTAAQVQGILSIHRQLTGGKKSA